MLHNGRTADSSSRAWCGGVSMATMSSFEKSLRFAVGARKRKNKDRIVYVGLPVSPNRIGKMDGLEMTSKLVTTIATILYIVVVNKV